MGNRFYVVKEQAVPEVLLKVVEAKKLLDSGRAHTVSRSGGDQPELFLQVQGRYL